MPDTLLSRPVRLSDIPAGGKSLEVTADDAERVRLAEAFGLLGIDRFSADLALTKTGDGFTARGRLLADVVYACVVTLEPLPGHIEEPVEMRFSTSPERMRVSGEEIEVRYGEEDPPEPIVNGIADVGPILAEFLALALDPYPKTPGAELDADALPKDERENPFAALARLKHRDH